jgi:membrane-associated phospholipid phosphatase
MRRYLLVALWPAGIAAIAAATVIAARRAPVPAAPPAADDLVGQEDRTEPAGTANAGRNGAKLAEVPDPGGNDEAKSARAAASIPAALRWLSDPAARPDWVPDLIRLGAVSCAGGVLSYGVMALLGPTVVNHGLAIDEPILRWTTSHQVKKWAAVMERLGKVGNPWTTWGAAATAAVCLGVTWRKQKWLPPAALGAAIAVDHYVTLALRRKFNRLGPPTSPLGTYPSGGCARTVLLYGLIAHMLWREFGGSYRAKVWAIGTVAALSFNEAYSREYLSKHWFTDIISGTFFGAVLLGPFIAAVRLIAGPVRVDSDRGGLTLAAVATDRASRGAGVPPRVTASDPA